MRREGDMSIEFRNLEKENYQIKQDQEDLYAFIDDENETLKKTIDTLRTENEELKQKLVKPL